MRIAIARIYHETNTFNPVPTTLDVLKSYGYREGQEMLEASFIAAEMAGAVEEAGSRGIELIGLIKAGGWAGGKLKQQDYEYLKGRLLSRLQDSLPVDGLYLALHGALVGEEVDDIEGDLLEAVREIIGDIPLALSLDMHANITEKMARLADFLVGYHTCPHLDTEQMGRVAVGALDNIISGASKPVIHRLKLPMITPADRHDTFKGPLAELFAKVARIEADPDVLSASIFPVQPWLDVPELGWTVVVVTNGETGKGKEYCARLAEECKQRKEDFEVKKLTTAEAVRRAREIDGGPVVISDSADATNAGACGNSTHLLSEMLRTGVNGTALVPLLDPAMARQAHEVGIGGIVEGLVGAYPQNPFSPPVNIRAEVLATSDGRFSISGHGGGNVSMDMGKTAALGIGNVVLVVSENAGPGHDPLLFRHIGFEPRDAKIVVVKSPVGFRAAYEPFAREIILADTPGAASSNLTTLNFTKRPKPMYPFEEIKT
jgi:microcystin degradation protein MlrC